VKLILHALHENNVPFINSGEPVEVLEISTGLSLVVIIAVLVVTVFASLFSRRGKAQTAINNARRHAKAYLDSEYTHDPAERERIFRMLLGERDHILALGPKYRQLVRDEPALMELLDAAADKHDQAVERGEAEPFTRKGLTREGPA
jgi:tellurite resistance protein TerC